LRIADFDGDGLLDIAFAEQEQSASKRIGIFLNGGAGASWNLQVLATTGGHNLKTGIIGNDLLPSLLCANHGFYGAPNPVELWRNITSAPVIPPPQPPSGGPVSDEFNSPVLNTSLWTLQNPLGDATVQSDGSAALISVPANTAHDPWFSNNAAILTQNVQNVDFAVEVKFDSTVALQYQMQGIMVESDRSNYLRFEIFSDGVYAHVFAASFVADVPTVRGNLSLPLVAGPFWIRVRRSGDTWTQTWSTDGVNFNDGFVFNQPLSVTRLGPYVGNSAGSGLVPAMTATVDYFRVL
jgi:regulation of enolase protein 1 (concanavalin A-like superfamily)